MRRALEELNKKEKLMKALLIDVNFFTGKRPAICLDNKGKIKENLWCGHRWQNLDTGKEIRVVKDGDIAPYEGVTGITILNKEDEIRAALAEHCPSEEIYTVSNEGIHNASINSTIIDWNELPQTATQNEELAFLYDKGIRGIDHKIMSPQDPLEISKE